MTGSDDSSRDSRPISVAELLAKNGTIGSPPVGGRRRRRRGNADAVTVAELTGEIPVIRTEEPDSAPETPAVEEQVVAADDQSAEADTDAVPSAGENLDDAETETGEVETQTETGETGAEAAETESAEVEVAEASASDSVGDSAGGDVDDDYADAVAEYAAHVEHRVDADPVVAPKPRRFSFGRQSSKKADKRAEKAQILQKPVEPVAADAERMSPDPPDDGESTDVLDTQTDLAASPAIDDLDNDAAPDATASADVDTAAAAETDAQTDTQTDTVDTDELPSYLRSTQEPLFGGQTVADDLARRGGRGVSGDVEQGRVGAAGEDRDGVDDGVEDAADAEPRRMSAFAHGLWIVGQSIFAVILGAALFFAFDQLWRWNNIIALVLSVLVILGLVVAVRVVRRTEDIGSTLIAVAVGALVTLGPLALLQSG